jgi:hypothetical protein
MGDFISPTASFVSSKTTNEVMSDAHIRDKSFADFSKERAKQLVESEQD